MIRTGLNTYWMKINNETKVGVLAAVAITILILGYSFLKGNDVFSDENEFYAVYERVDGLVVSNPVLVNGFQIGRVSQLTLSLRAKSWPSLRSVTSTKSQITPLPS